jgi:hypothetical protein
MVPMKMKLTNHTAALLPLTPTGTSGALLIRAPVITAALRQYFEMLWEKRRPLRPNGLRRPRSVSPRPSRWFWR